MREIRINVAVAVPFVVRIKLIYETQTHTRIRRVVRTVLVGKPCADAGTIIGPAFFVMRNCLINLEPKPPLLFLIQIDLVKSRQLSCPRIKFFGRQILRRVDTQLNEHPRARIEATIDGDIGLRVD